MKTNKESINNTPQKSTEYQPTTAEKKLLAVLMNPENRLKSITEICGIAKCDRKTYYNAFNKHEFAAYFKKESYLQVNRSLAAIINSSIHQAKRGSATHAKMLLTMAGVYTDEMTFPDRQGKPQPSVTVIVHNDGPDSTTK